MGQFAGADIHFGSQFFQAEIRINVTFVFFDIILHGLEFTVVRMIIRKV